MLSVVFHPRAEQEILEAEAWREQKGVIRAAMVSLANNLILNPFLGQAVEGARRPGLRRFYVGSIGYHVFYRVDQRRGLIVIFSVWHERRRPPRF